MYVLLYGRLYTQVFVLVCVCNCVFCLCVCARMHVWICVYVCVCLLKNDFRYSIVSCFVLLTAFLIFFSWLRYIRECPPYTGIGHLVNLFEKETPEKVPFEMPAERKKRVRSSLYLLFVCVSFYNLIYQSTAQASLFRSLFLPSFPPSFIFLSSYSLTYISHFLNYFNLI